MVVPNSRREFSRREFLLSSAGLGLVLVADGLRSVYAQTTVNDISNKIDPTLITEKESEKLPYYELGLVDVLIVYHKPITVADKSMITQLGGVAADIEGLQKILRAGLPYQKIKQYANHPNVRYIEPNYSNLKIRQ